MHINEIKMTTKSLKPKAFTTGAKVGIEFELIKNYQPNPNDEQHYSHVPNHSLLGSINTMSDLYKYFEIDDYFANMLTKQMTRWIIANNRNEIIQHLSTDFDTYFSIGIKLGVYTSKDQRYYAKKDFEEIKYKEPGSKSVLITDKIINDVALYKTYIGNPLTEYDYFADKHYNSASNFYHTYRPPLKPKYMERIWSPEVPMFDITTVEDKISNYFDYSGWTTTDDISLGNSGVEIISPPLPITNIEKAISNIKHFASKEDFYTNEKCGLHINVSVPGFSHEKLDYLKLCLMVGDSHVLEKFGRSSNKYCTSSMHKVQQAIRDKNIQPIIDHLRSTLGKQCAIKFKDISKLYGISEKVSSIGIKDNRIEFRSVGGDWLSRDENDVLEMVYRFTYCLYAACNPEIEKKEYGKKLYAFLQQFSDGKTEPLLSSLVISGSMSAKDALSQLKSK